MFLKLNKSYFAKKCVSSISYPSKHILQKRNMRTTNLKKKLNKVLTQNDKVPIYEEKQFKSDSRNLTEKIKIDNLKWLNRIEQEESYKNGYKDEIEKDDNTSYREYFNECNNKYYDKNNDELISKKNDNEIIRDEYKFIFERPKHFAHIDDDPIIRRPGCIIDIKTLMRNNWTFPAVGFNSKLEIPIYKFESDENDDNIKFITVPNDIFGLPIRSDILHKCYYFYRTALAGYTERMQLYKWEWPGSTKKYRSQKKSGKARMNWRKTCGRYLGVKNHPIRPHDQKTDINKKFLWKGMKILLSAKFAQDQIKVVDNFLIKSHKTKYTVKYLRNILGKKCNSALLVHEGKTDVNDNFLWACANIASIKRENVEGVNIYNLLKYRYVIFTYKALKNIIYELKIYPYKMKWLPTYATPNNTRAPNPEKVNNWNIFWIEKKKRNDFSQFDKDALKKRIQEWKWSSDLKGPLKVKKKDPYKNFILTKFQCDDPLPEFIKYEYLFNVENEFDNINDSEDHFNMIDEILNDDECLEDVSSLSSPISVLEEKEKNNKKEYTNEDSLSNDEDSLSDDEEIEKDEDSLPIDEDIENEGDNNKEKES
ncbi:mitochondrial ribosomal protein L4 precursor, putative [Plasmodium relictum]|uniref:Large ribosomal subunit protein uL4m n=1 Tax=Plasmodium relictum TaxID=85471 RepID=A0A1J1H2E6_PLARL|nr:mitochondrial ribosomal protein L4 precursor, putative [Plasmodium relictum]CRG98861.1 mitochondrial ribosomal protein L4 precursor, putative [Plasmodium relictum]